jgi:bifunctional lysine-specific demethylase and histidyl-hydroxylase NO66
LRRVTVESSLAWLLQPLPVQTFLDKIWGATHYHVKRGCPAYFDSLLNGPSAVEELLECFRCEPSAAVRLIRGNDKIDPAAYRLADGSLDLARVRNDFADGYTIVLDNVERYVRTIGSLSHSIEVELNFPTQVNAYVTPPESRGFVPHYDEHDVLILQVQGSKTWHLYDVDIPPHEMERREAVDAAALPSPTGLLLETGDVLYLPRGRVHGAETGSEPSLHVTVGIHAPTVLTLMIRALHSLSFTDDRIHTRLPPRYLDDLGIRASLADPVRDMVRTVEHPSVIAESLDALEDALVRRGRCPPVGQISDSVGIDGQTPVVKYQPLYSRVTGPKGGDAGGVALQFAQLSIRADANHEAAMLFLSSSTAPFRVRDLPGLTAAQQTELARTLIVSGFLVRLPDDSL